jgi:hypothetical protein
MLNPDVAGPKLCDMLSLHHAVDLSEPFSVEYRILMCKMRLHPMEVTIFLQHG